MSEARTATQYCPYCGDTNLWPNEASHGAWECRDCGRVFSVSFLGLSGRAVSLTSTVGSGTLGDTEGDLGSRGSQTGDNS